MKFFLLAISVLNFIAAFAFGVMELFSKLSTEQHYHQIVAWIMAFGFLQMANDRDNT